MKKKQYKKMTIVAVPLKPEQAVLSCCNVDVKLERDTPFTGNQCEGGSICATAGVYEMIDS